MGFYHADSFSYPLVKAGVEVLKNNPKLLEKCNCKWSDLMHLEEFVEVVSCGQTYHNFIATPNCLLVQIPDPAEYYDDGWKTVRIPYALLGLAYSLGYAVKHEENE